MTDQTAIETTDAVEIFPPDVNESLQPASAGGPEADPMAAIIAQLRADGAETLENLVRQLVTQEDVLSADEEQQLLTQALLLFLGAFSEGEYLDATYRAIGTLPARLASQASDLLLLANFGDDSGTLADLDDATVLCLTALTAVSGGADEAAQFLGEAARQRPAPAFRRAAYAARCRALGLNGAIGQLWTAPHEYPLPLSEAEEAVAQRPLDPSAHRQFGRRLAENGLAEDALAAFAVGLALPIDASEKAGLGEDLAVMAAYLEMQGEAKFLESRRVRLALGACLPAAARAEKILNDLAKGPATRALDDSALAAATRYFRDVAWHPEAVNASAYPMRNGRPHVDTVWLEITNHCNQKCTFCPDMHREDPRTWLPLEQVKRLIDELAETFSVGSMQLNAYGEPLVHPNIKEILAYIREKQLPWPTFFTSHGMTLVDKKLQQLSHNYPAGIAISLHNDSQESYAATRSEKIGDYETLVTRVSALLRQMANEAAPSHLRLYQMVSNGNEDMRVDPRVRGAFPATPERMVAHVRKWEAIAAEIAATAPPEVEAQACVNTQEWIETCFFAASHGDGNHIPILHWRDSHGRIQKAFMSPRPVCTYANLLLEYHPDWAVERQVVNKNTCYYFAHVPSLAIFATGKLGICCLDMNSTAVFGSLSDFGTLREALTSPEARRMFAQLSNGIAVSRGCQICLGTSQQRCGSGSDAMPAVTELG
jgi:uncharacterized radical SAM superfamily Fe-S cluster-containing enzyme